MHIAFVDESGDVGLRNSPTRHFVLCAALEPNAHFRRSQGRALLRRADALFGPLARLDP